MTELVTTARALVAEGKGILAADESTGTMDKRLTAVGVAATAESRRQFREIVVTTPGLGESISGVILFDETFRQKTSDGTPIPRTAEDAGMLPGIKVDTGAKPLAMTTDETVTEGLDGLRERLAEYVELGARFAKWRAVIRIGEQRPTTRCLRANAHALARYAALCQEAGVVPIVEPEVLMDGDHSLERSEQATGDALDHVFAELAGQGVLLEGIVLKPNMVLPGTDHPDQRDVAAVVTATLRCLRRHVPAAVPGIAFLSGGQGDEAATVHLDALNRADPQPWRLTFSYGRALLSPALSAWAGREDEAPAAQRILAHRARCNGAAAMGRYSPELEDRLEVTASA
ncbi:class I fructose-bisphosphate aldolase [Pseudonocardia sp. CA-142604]|uniref:class I fructose-bisphosphate aldolase n=1 Tax=Pseudonocardia sp. CA-142604 TaxID=3240024 RepID=UPI003D945EA1